MNGGQAQVAPEWLTIRAVFHNFAKLPSQRGVCTLSPVLKCHGLEWQIELYPGGHGKSSEDYVYVSLFLKSVSCTDTNKIRAKAKYRVPSANMSLGGVSSPFHTYSTQIDGNDDSPSWGLAWGYRDYAKREAVLNASYKFLVGGSLTVEIDIQVLDKPPLWTPTNTVRSDKCRQC